MKSLRRVFYLAVVSLALTSCALIPPIPIGPGALGDESTEFDMVTPQSLVVTTAFTDADKPYMPFAPSAFRSVRGFGEQVTVSGAPYPAEIVITADSGLEITFEDQRANPPEPVVASAPFGPLTLARSAECIDTDTDCVYTFTDPAAAAVALTVEISGEPFKRLLDIIFEDGTYPNTMSLRLTIATDRAFAMKFTVNVVQNYIKL
jgi:hypothetical protein